MFKYLTLRHRFIAICIILSGIVALFFTSMVYVSISTVETDLFGNALNSEADWLIHLDNQNQLHNFNLPENWTLYKGDVSDASAFPTAFRDLKAGFHEVLTEGGDFHAYVESVGDTKYILTFDQSAFEKREKQIMLLLSLLFVMSLGFGALIGNVLSSIALQPITNLAGRVSDINPEQPEPKLVSYYSDDVVGQLARAFDALIQRTRYFLLQEKLFTGDVSHELRTPLTIISGAVDVLAKQPGLTVKEQNSIARIQTATAQMAELVSAFIQLSKQDDGGKLDKHPIAVNVIAAAELLAVKENLEKRNVKTYFVENAFLQVITVKELLATVIRNLIQNASRHTQRGKVEVTVNADSIEICDTGSGISDVIVNRVFHQKARASSTDSQGHGLGLAIVKRICDFNGWDIMVESTARGTHFVITFPDTALEKPPLQATMVQ